MHKTPWRPQDAKAQFSAAVDAALQGEAQLGTRRGRLAGRPPIRLRDVVLE